MTLINGTFRLTSNLVTKYALLFRIKLSQMFLVCIMFYAYHSYWYECTGFGAFFSHMLSQKYSFNRFIKGPCCSRKNNGVSQNTPNPATGQYISVSLNTTKCSDLSAMLIKPIGLCGTWMAQKKKEFGPANKFLTPPLPGRSSDGKYSISDHFVVFRDMLTSIVKFILATSLILEPERPLLMVFN